MCMVLMVDRHVDVEPMRLGDVVQRFPVICAPRECKRLTGAVFTPGLNGHSLHRLWSRRREPETRRLPELVDGKLENTMLPKHPLQFRTVNRIGAAIGLGRKREAVGMSMRTVAMPVPVARAKVKPGRNGNP